MKVELLNIFGNDEMVADCARVSYQKEASNYTDQQNEKLINFLARENHWSPFSHPKLQFRLQIPIYIERQLIKTAAGVEYNSISGRYVDFSDTYYEIEQFRTQSKDSKQGSGEDLAEWANEDAKRLQSDLIDKCSDTYNKLIDLGVSKEQARSVLPLSLETTMIWTGSLYSFIRLYKQRTKSDAQKEINMVVTLMMEELKKTDNFKHSLKAYGL